jgi:hypothetical protein
MRYAGGDRRTPPSSSAVAISGSRTRAGSRAGSTPAPGARGDRRGLRIKNAFQELYEQPSEHAEVYLADWVEMGVTCDLQPIEDFACSVAEHWDGVYSGQLLG